MKRGLFVWLLLAPALGGCSSAGAAAPAGGGGGGAGGGGGEAGAGAAADTTVDLPGAEEGIGLDDLRFSATLDRVIVAGSATGTVDLVDPDTLEVTTVSVAPATKWLGSDLQGPQSADEGAGNVFTVDRSAYRLVVIDPLDGEIAASLDLDHTEPDYVRWAASRSEVWITRPGKGGIDVYTVPETGTPTPVHDVFIPIAGGTEGLAIDESRDRAYTHSSGHVIAIDMANRALVGDWPTSCGSSHGIPVLDEERGLLFAGCSSAKVVVLDLDGDGAELASYALDGGGATILAYSPSLHHFYLRGDGGPTTAILGVGGDGALTLLGTVESAPKGHCATTDDRGQLWICQWKPGRLWRFADPYPATDP
jgi:hypothetical protein